LINDPPRLAHPELSVFKNGSQMSLAHKTLMKTFSLRF
jgi:hypothetical protein